MSDYLPPEVLTIIFAKMPIKTLVRCVLVCQSWHSIIKSQDFINLHFKWKKPDLFLIRSQPIMLDKEVYALHFDNEGLTKYAEIDLPFRPSYNYYYKIVGSCNGVLCLSDDLWYYASKIILWNPAIRKSLRLPRHPISLEHCAFHCVTGFGFYSDSDSNDYKVVRITYYEDVGVRDEVNVYSLSSGTWQNVIHPEPKIPFICSEASQAYINKAVHWIASDAGSETNFIMSYNLSSSEAFHTVELPDRIPYISPHHLNSKLRPAIIEGSLALFESNEGKYCIWLMEEYGICSSWYKKIEVETKIPMDRLVGVKNNGELLVEMRGDLYAYDPEAMKGREQYPLDCLASLHHLMDPPHFPEIKGLNILGIRSIYSGHGPSDYECALYIESFKESLVFFGMPTNVEENESDSEERETTSSEEETESSEDDTEYESSKEEILQIESGEETESKSIDKETEREDESNKR